MDVTGGTRPAARKLLVMGHKNLAIRALYKIGPCIKNGTHDKSIKEKLVMNKRHNFGANLCK